MRRFVKFIDIISNFLATMSLYISAVTLCFMTSFAGSAVLFRYVLRSPLDWAEEASRFLLILFAFAATSYGLKKGRHIGITFLLKRLPGKFHLALDVFNNLVIILFCVYLFDSGMKLIAIGRVQTSPILNLPLWVAYMIIPIFTAVMIIHLIDDLLNILEDAKKGLSVSLTGGVSRD
jgi:TRAP-type C4-dicarboxylate transport system permease small subunit